MEVEEKINETQEERIMQFAGKLINEIGAAANGSLIIIGEKLGLYQKLAKEGRMTYKSLAASTGTDERLVREWVAAQAASGFVEYDDETNEFYMSPEQIMFLADPQSPLLMTGAFYSISSMYHDEPKLTEAFKSGNGVQWGDHHNCLFCGVEKFFSPTYKSSLIDVWIPAFNGLKEKLEKGVLVADVGCGHGVSTMVMAEAFPKSTFIGYDYHGGSIKHAQEIATAKGLTNVHFEKASAKDYPQKGYQLITFFDCLHDMGDPVGAIKHATKALAKDGTCMIVEPFAHDNIKDNFTPLGRAYYAFSTMICTPTSLSQEVALGLGSQAGKTRLEAVIKEGGFEHCNIAVETPFNFIFEVHN